MIKKVLTLTVVAAFAAGSAFAGSCGDCPAKDKDKKKGKGKETPAESHSTVIAL